MLGDGRPSQEGNIMPADTVMFYSESGGTKTTQAWFVAKYVYERWGLLTLWISADGGGWKPVADEGAIELGIVNALDVRGRPRILADMRKLVKGWWPQKYYVDGKRYKLNGDALPMQRLKPEDAARIGCIVIEGFYSLAEAFKGHIAEHGAGIGGGQDGRPWTYEEDDEVFGGTGKQHYLMIQNELYKLAMTVASLPNTKDENAVRMPNLKFVVWTSLVGKGEGKNTVTKYGPQVAGSAVTTHCPQWLGDCLHIHKFSKVRIEEETNIQAVENFPCAFFLEHPDPETGIPYLAKPRVAPSAYNTLLKEFPGGYVALDTKRGITPYFEAIERLSGLAKNKLSKWKEGVDAKHKEEGLDNGTFLADNSGNVARTLDSVSDSDRTGLEEPKEEEKQEEDVLKLEE